MKMKKYVLLFSMIAVLGALTACSSGTQEVSFEYEDYRDWFTKLLDWIVDTLSMDIMDLFRRDNDEDY